MFHDSDSFRRSEIYCGFVADVSGKINSPAVPPGLRPRSHRSCESRPRRARAPTGWQIRAAQTKRSRVPFGEPGSFDWGARRLAIRYVRESPIFSEITVIPCFFVRDPPALMSALVVCDCQPNFLQMASSVMPSFDRKSSIS